MVRYQKQHAIYDGLEYTETCERDLVEADNEIIISSPGLQRSKVERLISLLKSRQEAGVSVIVITMDPEVALFGDIGDIEAMVSEMKIAGIMVRLTDSEGERFAVIDRKLVWHGGMNLLGKADVYDNLLRVRNEEVAAELLAITNEMLAE